MLKPILDPSETDAREAIMMAEKMRASSTAARMRIWSILESWGWISNGEYFGMGDDFMDEFPLAMAMIVAVASVAPERAAQLFAEIENEKA